MKNGHHFMEMTLLLRAIHLIKANKKDADLTLESNAILNVPSILFSLLYVLINAITIHGYVSQLWLSGNILTLLKSANLDKSLLPSFRPITLTSRFIIIRQLL